MDPCPTLVCLQTLKFCGVDVEACLECVYPCSACDVGGLRRRYYRAKHTHTHEQADAAVAFHAVALRNAT